MQVLTQVPPPGGAGEGGGLGGEGGGRGGREGIGAL